MGAFHAYDIRGIYNVDFDKDVAYKVGYFLPELLSADKVLVGRDGRVSSVKKPSMLSISSHVSRVSSPRSKALTP